MIVSKEDVLSTLTAYLGELFEIPAQKVTPGARLFEDLELDSIDAVELVVKLQSYTGRKIAPAEFKTVRTVGDIVDRLHGHFSQQT